MGRIDQDDILYIFLSGVGDQGVGNGRDRCVGNTKGFYFVAFFVSVFFFDPQPQNPKGFVFILFRCIFFPVFDSHPPNPKGFVRNEQGERLSPFRPRPRCFLRGPKTFWSSLQAENFVIL